MAKFSLCIEPVLTGLDFYDRIKAAADLGLDAVEFWDPVDRDIDKIAALSRQHNIPVAICCLKQAWTIRLNFPASVVIKNVTESVEIAKAMGCPSLIGLSGDVEAKTDTQKNILIENLKRVADVMVKADVTLNVEALNSLVDHKGYYLDSTYLGFEILQCVNCDNIRLLYDVYHMQIMEGNIIENVTKNIANIGHFHSAGTPGRHEHFGGDNDYNNIIQAVEKTGYDRYFGLEYWPTYEDEKSIADVMNYLRD
ncbi:MAG: TIM barrel protein [Planctomycetes bacterium]|nr:TIM barrel protein [Planctomycetota bacterium]